MENNNVRILFQIVDGKGTMAVSGRGSAVKAGVLQLIDELASQAGESTVSFLKELTRVAKMHEDVKADGFFVDGGEEPDFDDILDSLISKIVSDFEKECE